MPMRKEFLAASALHLLCLAWFFRAPLLSGGVDALLQSSAPPPASMINLGEQMTEIEPAVFTQARLLKRGLFPSWTSDSQGGTPLIGKMQGQLFAPYLIPAWLMPAAWMPYMLWLSLALKLYLAFAFAYLYARALKLGPPAAFFAGSAFAFMELATTSLSAEGAGVYLPLLLLLVELYFSGRRTAALLLLPWAAALPFFAGHFESGVWMDAACAVYFALRGGGLAGLAASLAAGAALCAVQIVPAAEYLDLSYSRVWHDSRWFSFWDLETVSKHLTWGDAPLLAGGWTAFAAFVFFVRANREQPVVARAARWAAAAVSLAAALACLARVGLDVSLHFVALPLGNSSTLDLALVLALLSFALLEWLETEEPGLRALGWLLLAAAAAVIRLPPFCNLLLHIPPFRKFHNGLHRWEYQLGLAVLAAAGLERLWRASRLPWAQRRPRFEKSLTLVAAVVAGAALSGPLERELAARAPTGLAAGDLDVGFMGPERHMTYGRSRVVSGRLTDPRLVTGVDVLLEDGPRVAASAPAALKRSASTVDFRAELPLNEPGHYRLAAVVHLSDGRAHADQRVAGGTIDVLRRPGGRCGAWAAAGPLAVPLLVAAPGYVVAAAGAAALAEAMTMYRSRALPAARIPEDLPAMRKLLEQQRPFRVFSFSRSFMRADYPNVYGLADLDFGDNLDLLSMYYFLQLGGELGDPRDPAVMDRGLRLLGLAGVKYLLELPRTAAPPETGGVLQDYQVHALQSMFDRRNPAERPKGLAPFYAGPDMSVFTNAFAISKAAFFDRAVVLSPIDLRDWGRRGEILGPLAGALRSGELDPLRALVLNDPPSSAYAAPGPREPPARGTATVEEYRQDRLRLSVEAPRAGFVFVNDNLYPGWRATLNGKPARILRSWITFRAVEVPAGRSTLVFEYRSWSLRAAATLSAATAAALLGLLLFFWTPPRPDEPIARLAEGLTILLVACSSLYWLLWSAFVYEGGIQRGREGLAVNAAALLLLVGALACLGRRCFKSAIIFRL